MQLLRSLLLTELRWQWLKPSREKISEKFILQKHLSFIHANKKSVPVNGLCVSWLTLWIGIKFLASCNYSLLLTEFRWQWLKPSREKISEQFILQKHLSFIYANINIYFLCLHKFTIFFSKIFLFVAIFVEKCNCL